MNLYFSIMTSSELDTIDKQSQLFTLWFDIHETPIIVERNFDLDDITKTELKFDYGMILPEYKRIQYCEFIIRNQIVYTFGFGSDIFYEYLKHVDLETIFLKRKLREQTSTKEERYLD